MMKYQRIQVDQDFKWQKSSDTIDFFGLFNWQLDWSIMALRFRYLNLSGSKDIMKSLTLEVCQGSEYASLINIQAMKWIISSPVISITFKWKPLLHRTQKISSHLGFGLTKY